MAAPPLPEAPASHLTNGNQPVSWGLCSSHLLCSNFCSALPKQLSLLLCPLAILPGVGEGGPAQGLPSLLPPSDLLLPSLLDPSVFEL